MRYLWPMILVVFVLFSVDFATQNSDMVLVHYTLDWLNYGVRIERPLFVTLYLTLALGILFSVLYFLFYHTRLHARIRKLRSENRKLQKQLEEEQGKTQKLEEQATSQHSSAIPEITSGNSRNLLESESTDTPEISKNH